MKRKAKYILIVVICVSGLFAMNAGYSSLLSDSYGLTVLRSYGLSQEDTIVLQSDSLPAPVDTIYSNGLPEEFSRSSGLLEEDTIGKPRIPVKKTFPQEYDDLKNNSASDLRDPENLKTEIEYDLNTGDYLLRSKIGDFDLGVPLRMSPEEYQHYTLKQSLNQYFQERYKEAWDSINATGARGGNRLNLMDMQFDIAGADRIFGPGGVRLTTRGSIGMDMGLKTSKTNNPALPEKSRSRTFFNFDTNVQVNTTAQVGTKINYTMNYNTLATFDFDAARLKLAYSGDEDEIIKSLEGGNVNLTTSNSLIRGGATLFGVKTDLQFGKLRVRALLAQQQSESRSVSSKGGADLKEFAITADNYEDSRHYFLAHYFRDNYDRAMSKLPYIASPVSINRVEVWITNKVSSTGQTRNIVAFSDLGEYNKISNPVFMPSGNIDIPYNEANTLYRTIVDMYSGAREISSVTQTFNGFIEGGMDYEKIESARLLSQSDYSLNTQLGYISLNARLQTDEVLAVAFEYTYNGMVYQVGEFSSDKTENTNQCLYLKTLKGTSLSPAMPFWDLMMKNIYWIPNASSVQKDKFRLDIVYQSDTAGTYVYTIPEGNISDQTLLKVMNLDRLNSKNEAIPGGGGDGFFDFVEGYTIVPNNGRIIFPVVEPFGTHLRAKIGDDAIADKYVYQELYDSTLTIAKQIAEKNKFVLRGQYAGSSPNIISLGSMNVPRGSVVVRANGITLTEGVDYFVNYSAGTVTITNENLITSKANIQASSESRSMFNMKRRTMMGADLSYEFSKNFHLGGTIMHLSEMPVTTKTSFGDESVKNTLWGFNFDYKGQSQLLTNLLDKIPLLSLTQPSSYSVNAEFAHLIAGHYTNRYTGDYSYLDDFESTQSEYDLLNPYFWHLASTPYDDNTARALFPEASLINDVTYGKNRALFAWYWIDGIFTRRNSNLRPSYMTNDDISNHYVRAVQIRELFPERDLGTRDNNYLNVLNLAFYPSERGPYNLDADNILSDGSLMNPEKRWGGITRNMDQTDFEMANFQYIECWIMDPFIYNENSKGGDLYFNLGEVSEDVLKDEKKFFENGLPVDGDMSLVDTTVWGKVPKQQSTVYAFDNTAGTRRLQDVGLNGLSSEEERSRNGSFPAYDEFLDKLERNVLPEILEQMRNDPFSPLNDPATDTYRYYRGADFDRQQADILTRYKRYNGTEGNSAESEDTQESYGTSARQNPDVEDLNNDNTLNENEKYYQYKISLRPEDMEVGMNYIVDKKTSPVRLPNGMQENVTWYQFKIPIRSYTHKVGSIADFSSIRFMRTFMTGFEETTILRFGKFALVRGDWRPYQQPLYKSDTPPTVDASISVSTVNIEENSDRQPINYVLPPGITRITDPTQPQLRQQNEQSLSLKVENLASQDARAIYKNTNFDLRRYKRMQLFVHAEKLVDDVTNMQNGDLSVFIRLGTDYKNNFYEYEIPLTLTPFGNRQREIVWPTENMFNFSLSTFTDLKLERNRAKSMGEGSYNTIFSKYDPEDTRNTISVIGNPTISDVQVIMIGIRNNSRDTKSAEIWINELRMTDFDETGGWAANTTINLSLSDFATVNATGSIMTAGFGSTEQSVSQRPLEDFSQVSVATTVQLGKFFPEKVKVTLPLYYAYSRDQISPLYNPLDQDILLKEAINNETTQAGKDSIRSFANSVVTTQAVAFNNVRLDIRSKNPMPYDPANFSIGYASSSETRTNPETEYENTKQVQGNLGYRYSPYVKPLKPFSKIKDSDYTRILKQFAFNYLPSSLSLQNSIARNYYEIQLRDLNDVRNASRIPVSFSQNFFWDRSLNITWKPLQTLSLDLSTKTNARIEEGYYQVNKSQNPDDFELWKDTVMRSIAELGTPLLYDQTFSAAYALPLQEIPIFDWINGSVNYKATYKWEKGSYVDEVTNMGNTIRNDRSLIFDGGLNLVTLYNKNEFLKKVNQKSNQTRPPATNRPGVPARTLPTQSRQQQPTRKEFVVTLSPDSGVIIQHNLLTKKVLFLSVRLADDSTKRYDKKITYKALDFARIQLNNRDSVTLKITMRAAPSKEETFLYKIGENTARTLMMLRRITFNYTLNDGMFIPSFMPSIGSWFGQGPSPVGNAPGWGFAFGDVRRSYFDEVAENQWLVYNTDNITPGMIRSAKQFTGSVQLEPLPGMKIELRMNYTDTRNTEIRFMYAGMPETRNGNFSMSTIGLGGFFSGTGDARKGYQSDVFLKMLDNREIIATRMQNRYQGRTYPDVGFISETSYRNTEYNPNNGAVGLNSGDAAIPAFIAAYTNKDPQKVGLTAFPSMSSMLPNWNLTYDGLMKIPSIADHLSALNITHRYNCTYNIGNYNSYLNWVNAGIEGDLGYVRNTETGAPIPSMGYEITSVSLTEKFDPLIGLDATFLNNLTAGIKNARSRTMNYNVTSYQLVESYSNDLTVSIGYKYAEFNKILKMKKKADFSNDLTVRLDYTYRKALSLLRKLEDGFTQATQGSIAQMLQFKADYGVSKKITLSAFYDLQINQPLVSSTAFPTSNSNYGISLQVSLND